MTTDIAVFDFKGSSVRTVTIAGEPWFVARDVCDALSINNVAQAVIRLDDDEKSQVSVPDVTNAYGSSQRRTQVVVNEPGLYSLILRSRKPEARAFKRWITHEVLPEIRAWQVLQWR